MCFQMPRRSASHGSLARTLCIPFGEYTDRLIATGNRQQTTTDPVHSSSSLKKRFKMAHLFNRCFKTANNISCFVCSHDRHHFLTLRQIYSITNKVQHSLQTRHLNLTATNEIKICRSVMIQAAKKYLPLPKNKMADLKKNTNNAPSSHCSSVQFRE